MFRRQVITKVFQKVDTGGRNKFRYFDKSRNRIEPPKYGVEGRDSLIQSDLENGDAPQSTGLNNLRSKVSRWKETRWKVRRAYFRLAEFVTAIKPLKLAILRSSLENNAYSIRKVSGIGINSPEDFATRFLKH